MKRFDWCKKRFINILLFISLAFGIGLYSRARAEVLPAASVAAQGGLIRQLLDKETTWIEGKIPTLPAMPILQPTAKFENNAQHFTDNNHQKLKFLAFDVPFSSQLQYAIDPRSLSIGTDGVIRYLLITRDKDGKYTFRFEGLHCAGNEWRLYAVENVEKTAWDEITTPWLPIGNNQNNSYHAALSHDYFCKERTVAGQPYDILKRMHDKRPLLVDQFGH